MFLGGESRVWNGDLAHSRFARVTLTLTLLRCLRSTPRDFCECSRSTTRRTPVNRDRRFVLQASGANPSRPEKFDSLRPPPNRIETAAPVRCSISTAPACYPLSRHTTSPRPPQQHRPHT